MVDPKKIQEMKKAITHQQQFGSFRYPYNPKDDHSGHQLKLYGTTLRINTLPKDGGKMLEDITRMANRNDMPFKKVNLSKWAILDHNAQLQKAFELGYMPHPVITGAYGEFGMNLNVVKEMVLHHPSNTLTYKAGGANHASSRWNKRLANLQTRLLATHAGVRLSQRGVTNRSFLPTTGLVHGVGGPQPTNRNNILLLGRRKGRLTRSNHKAIDRLKRVDVDDTSGMTNKRAAEYVVGQVNEQKPYFRYRQLQHTQKRARSDTQFEDVINEVGQIKLHIRGNSDIASRPAVLRHILGDMVQKYPRDVITIYGPSTNVLETVKNATDVLNAQGLHRPGKNVKRINLSPYRKDSETVSTRGAQLPRNFFDIPPNRLVFHDENRKKSWTFQGAPTPRAVAAGENHTVKYVGSDGKVQFRVHWSPNPKERSIHLGLLYFSDPRQPGEIPGQAVVNGLKGISREIGLTNASSIRMSNGSHLSRSLMPNSDIYKSFAPGYNNIAELRGPRALVRAMKGTKKLTMNELRELAGPAVNKQVLATVHRFVGTQASDENIQKATRVLANEHVAMFPRTWTRPASPPKGSKRSRSK